MKICLVANNLKSDTGLGRMVSNIARELESRGHEIGFVLGSGTSHHDFINISFDFKGSSLISFAKSLWKVRNFMRRYEYVVCYDVRPAGIIASVVSVGTKNKVIVHSLGTYSLFVNGALLKNLLISWVYKNAFRVFVINEFVKEKILESNKKFIFGANQIFVPVGVETSKFLSKSVSPSYITGDYMLSVGAIKQRKGQLQVLKAFKKIRTTYPSLKYVVVGSTKDSPGYYQEMLSFISNNGLSEMVRFIEDVNDKELINIYTNSLFFILTPVSTDNFIEGFGMVYIESALCGKTAIGTFGTGAVEAIEHMKTGLLADSDVDHISEAIEKLLSDNILRQELEKNAYTRALTFDWKNVVDLYEAEFNLHHEK